MRRILWKIALILIQFSINHIYMDIMISPFTNLGSLDRSSKYNSDQTLDELRKCNYSMVVGYTTVKCRHLQNFTQIMLVLRMKFSNRSIDRFYISNSSIVYLQAEGLANITINEFFIRRSRIGRVDDKFFVGTNSLFLLRLDNLNLTELPTSINLLNLTLRSLWMENGKLQKIGTELQMFKYIEMISFRCNKISFVDSEAFLFMDLLAKLDLSYNRIKKLNPSTFRSLKNLLSVKLNYNELQSVNGLFENNQYRLRKLMLHGNKIEDIQNITDRPMYSLCYLYLNENPIRVITNESFGRNYPRLVSLLLKNCELSSIDPHAFRYMTNLQQLRLENNKLYNLDDEIFSNMNKLNVIGLTSNYVKNIEKQFREKRISSLYLSYNDIEDIKVSFRSNYRLKDLRLNNNHVRKIVSNTFINNEKLQVLQLNENHIEYLENDSFRGLKSLKKLYMSKNNIQILNSSLDNLPQLQILNLSYNLLRILDPSHFRLTLNLKVIDVAFNKLITVHKSFKNLQNLEYLNIRNNYLNTLTNETFSPKAPLRSLKIIDNPIYCDCRIKWMLEHHFKLDMVVCSKPNWLKSQNVSNLQISDVVKWKTDCPDDCHCICRSNSADFYIDVNCANLDMDKTPYTLPKQTHSLDLTHNRIVEIQSHLLENLTQLEHLLLHFNNLTSLPDLTNLHLWTLTLANNKFTRLPIMRIKVKYLQAISLSNNPWQCECDTVPFMKWMISEKSKIIDVNQTICSNNNKKFKMRKIISLTQSLLCSSSIVMYSVITVIVTVILLLLAGSKIIYNRYRMHIRIWFYARGFACFKEEDVDEDKQFDAFISYSNLDEDFVMYELVPMLESCDKPYHLCLHYRNFVPGFYIQNNIINAVKASKRTILILSRNFLSSEWCRLEFKSAHHRVLEERLNRLIVIILGELPPNDDIDPEILLYLKTTTYLRWGEKNFWNKLQYIMPKNRCQIDNELVQLVGDYD